MENERQCLWITTTSPRLQVNVNQDYVVQFEGHQFDSAKLSPMTLRINVERVLGACPHAVCLHPQNMVYNEAVEEGLR